ncbi:MAG TPA: glycosyltransferase family 2 protein [Ignavibacteria bacterium]|nr:glycosyltransferase family 2 protein [Ignavibacteria bacterium]
MATYNGEKYIAQQLDSILNQLSGNDEVIISDDSSVDNTVKIIKQFGDKRVKLFENNKFRSPVYNFENALINATGDFIFLSDQDDIWVKNKVHKMTMLLDRYNVVVSDCVIVNENNEIIHDSFFKLRNSKAGLLKNIYKNSYLGCCMAFDRKILKDALPFPNKLHMHDMWIGAVAELFGKTFFCEEKLLKYRRHRSTVSRTTEKSSYSLRYKISYRLVLLKSILERALKHRFSRSDNT